jgi:hypothetical protein
LSREGLYKVITQINDVIYQNQQHPRAKMVVVHLEEGAYPPLLASAGAGMTFS